MLKNVSNLNRESTGSHIAKALSIVIDPGNCETVASLFVGSGTTCSSESISRRETRHLVRERVKSSQRFHHHAPSALLPLCNFSRVSLLIFQNLKAAGRYRGPLCWAPSYTWIKLIWSGIYWNQVRNLPLHVPSKNRRKVVQGNCFQGRITNHHDCASRLRL